MANQQLQRTIVKHDCIAHLQNASVKHNCSTRSQLKFAKRIRTRMRQCLHERSKAVERGLCGLQKAPIPHADEAQYSIQIILMHWTKPQISQMHFPSLFRAGAVGTIVMPGMPFFPQRLLLACLSTGHSSKKCPTGLPDLPLMHYFWK